MNLILSRTPKTVLSRRGRVCSISASKSMICSTSFSTMARQLVYPLHKASSYFKSRWHCADSEGGGGAWIPHPHPLKKYHESLGFLSNTVNGVSLAGRWWYLDPCSPPRPGPHQSTKINIVKIGPLFRNFLDPRMRRYRITITCTNSVCIFVLTATEWKANYFLVWRGSDVVLFVRWVEFCFFTRYRSCKSLWYIVLLHKN